MMSSMKVGLVIGLLTSFCHIVWIVLILAGAAQALMDFFFWAHMIQPVYVVKPFEPAAALTLVLLTFGIGYALGVVGGVLWNRFAGSRALQPIGERSLA
jgi:hypothetical protein